MYAQILDIDTVNQYFSFLHIVITRDKIYQGGFSSTALTHQGNGLALFYDKVDVTQHPFVGIFERHIAELYLMLEVADVNRMFFLTDVALCHENLINTLHGRHALGDVVAGTRKLFQWVDNAIENHQVINKGGAVEDMLVQYQNATKPQDDDDHHRAQEFTHGVRQCLTDIDTHDMVTVA